MKSFQFPDASVDHQGSGLTRTLAFRARMSLTRLLPTIRVILGLAITLLVLRQIDLSQVTESLARSDVRLIGLAALVALGSIFLRTVRWYFLLGPPHPYRLTRLLRATILGQFANAGLPLRVGDVARVAELALPSRREIVQVAVTVVVERCLDAALLAAGAAYLLTAFEPTYLASLIGKGALVLVLGGPLVLAAVYTMPFGRRFIDRIIVAAIGRAKKAGDQLRFARPSSIEVVAVVGLSVLIFAFSIAINQIVGLAVGVSLPLSGSVLVFVAVTVGAPLPSPPLRLGVFEALCWVALRPYNVPLETAVSFGILLHVVAFAWPVLGGLALVIGSRLPARRSSTKT